MQRTDRSVSDLLTDTSLPGALLSPFVYRITDMNSSPIIASGARAVNFLLIAAADDTVPPVVNGRPLTTQLSFVSEYPGNSLPSFAIIGQAGDDVLVTGVTPADLGGPVNPAASVQDEAGATIADELDQPLLPDP